MPRRRKPPTEAASRPDVNVPKELLDQLVKGPMTQGELESMFRELKRAVIERAMSAEMNEHLGYRQGENKPDGQANQRNGTSGKTVITDDGPVRIEVPRDREGSFEPQIIGKHQRRFTGFDQKIIAMYARGMTIREIQGYLAEMYGTEVSPEFISKVTDEVSAEITAWQSRPLEPMYPVVFFDALRVKIRDDAVVRNKAVYLALAILPDGSRDVLGIWIEQTEGAKFWLKVFNELRSRGVGDILIAVVDGLKGLSDAIETAFPSTTVQTCIVHLIRNSLDYASWKDRKAVAAALRPIYTAATAQAAEEALEEFATSDWGVKYPTIVQSWRRAWQNVVPFFAFPPDVRRVIYTTNIIESLHMQLRKIIKTRGHFPSDEAATKLLWLALRNITNGKVRSTQHWKAAMNQFAVLYGDRFINPKI
jgi:transposase-like protein